MVTRDHYFVDKSTLIKDVRILSDEINFITWPRRFGKTLNIDMIKKFYPLDGKDLFDGLKIGKRGKT